MALKYKTEQEIGATDVVGCSTQDLHQDVFVGARPLHGLPQLLHSVDDGRVQHGEDGLLKVPRQLLLQHVHQLLSQGDASPSNTPPRRPIIEASGTYVVVLVEVGLFDFLPLERAAVGQDVDDGLLVGP